MPPNSSLRLLLATSCSIASWLVGGLPKLFLHDERADMLQQQHGAIKQPRRAEFMQAETEDFHLGRINTRSGWHI